MHGGPISFIAAVALLLLCSLTVVWCLCRAARLGDDISENISCRRAQDNPMPFGKEEL